MLYQINNGTLSLGGETILSHIDFDIKGNEKIALVGRNGAGKTTLLRLIYGELEQDRDDRRKGPGIIKSREISLGFLRQTNVFDYEKTVDDIMLEHLNMEERFSREAMTYRAEYDKLFTGFGFSKEMKRKKLGAFSGGEQTKIALIKLLLLKPDLLLLDEPTNHLDISTVEWLENYMRGYQGAVVFVSHDRFFLDQVVDTVYELEDTKLKKYPGNYTDFRIQKRKNYEITMKAYKHQQEELARLNALIEKFKHKPSKASFARSRKSIIERTELIEKPSEDNVHIFTGPIEPRIPGGKWIFEADQLKIGYDRILLDITLRMRRGQKIGIIGDNGIGKSTFIKTVAGIIPPLKGRCTLGNNTLLGYFDQHSAEITSEKTVYEHYRELFPAIPEKDIRNTLGAYLFGGSDAAKKVDDLSGGEKARLVLCEILSAGPNLLLLDEPTNHMDIMAKETLESAFKAYTGSMLFISHDRYFVSQVADAILVFEKGRVLYYPFGYEHYVERKRLNESGDIPAMIDAENQALVADLHAVPKPERHRLREIGTEEAHVDWKLRLAGEPLEEAFELVRAIYDQKDELASLEEYQAWEKALETANEEWTAQCLKWYENYIELL